MGRQNAMRLKIHLPMNKVQWQTGECAHCVQDEHAMPLRVSNVMAKCGASQDAFTHEHAGCFRFGCRAGAAVILSLGTWKPWQKFLVDEGGLLTQEVHGLSKMLVRQLTVVLTWERKERSLQLEKLVRRIEVERAGCNAKLNEHHALITELMLSCMGHAPPNGVDNSRCGDGVQQAHKAETRKLGFDLNDRLTREISDRYLQIDVLMHQLQEECEKQNMNSDQHHAAEHESHVNQEFARGDAEESAECFNSVQDAYAMLLRDVSNVMTKWNASQEAFTQECASGNCGPAHSTSEGSLAMKADTVRWMRELEQRVEEVCAAASKNTR